MERIRPVDNFRKMVAVIRFFCRTIGVDVLDKDYKMTGIAKFVLIAIVGYFAFSAWVVVEMFAKDWSVLLDVISGLTCSANGAAKYLSILVYNEIYYSLCKDIENIYVKYQACNRKYEQKLFEWNVQMKRIFLVIAVVYFMVTTLVLSTPVVIYLYSGKLYPVALSTIPYIDKNTSFGYIMTNGWDVFCILLATFAFYACDIYLIMFLTYAMFFYDIFLLKSEDLRKLVKQNDDIAMQEIPDLVNDIVKWHQFYLEFTEKCNLIFYWTITVHMGCTTCAICTTLLIVFLKDWPGAYGYLVVLFWWLYMYSILGTRVEICNDQFCDGIYDINWYELPVPQQKTIVVMLTKSQLPRNIYFGGVVPLTVETALSITRTIYSMVMMVLQFRE